MIRKLRTRACVRVLLLLGAAAVCVAQDLAITRASVYSSPEAQVRSDVTVVIRHGVIAEIGEHLRVPKGIQTISCQGCVVVAGFWNAHVHFMEPKWNDAAHQPAEKLTSQMSEMLTHSGFTTVVDTGSDIENTVALRRRVESGEVSGPRIFTAGLFLCFRRGHCRITWRSCRRTSRRSWASPRQLQTRPHWSKRIGPPEPTS